MAGGSEPERLDLTEAFQSIPPEEWERREKEYQEEKSRERKVKRETFLESIRPKAFALTDPNRLNIKAKTMEKVLNWDAESDRGLLLYGSTGGGKTRLVWLLLTRLILEKGYRPLYYTSDALSRSLGSSYTRTRGHDDLMTKLFTRKILVIDDLGKEKPTARLEEDLFAVIRERTDNLRSLIITTNFVGDGLIERYTEPETSKPMLRRLKEFCEPIHIKGVDL